MLIDKNTPIDVYTLCCPPVRDNADVVNVVVGSSAWSAGAVLARH